MTMASDPPADASSSRGGARIESAAFRDERLASLPSVDPRVGGGEMESLAGAAAERIDRAIVAICGASREAPSAPHATQLG